MSKNRERKIIKLNKVEQRDFMKRLSEDIRDGIDVDESPIKIVKLKPKFNDYENSIENLSSDKEKDINITLPKSGLKVRIDDEKIKEVIKNLEEFNIDKTIREMNLPFVDEGCQNALKHLLLLPNGQVLNIKENKEEKEMKKEKREEMPITTEGMVTASKLNQYHNPQLDEQAQESIEKDNEEFATKLGEWYENEALPRCEDLPTLEESIKCRCEELKEEIDNEPELDGIVCYVGETVKQLIHEYNCNMYEFRLFDRCLVTNIGLKIIDTVIKAEMNYVNDTIIKFKLNGSDDVYSCTVNELMELGLAIWVDSDTRTLNLSGIEYRGLTKICCVNEIEL